MFLLVSASAAAPSATETAEAKTNTVDLFIVVEVGKPLRSARAMRRQPNNLHGHHGL
jgi:hypothetical protein